MKLSHDLNVYIYQFQITPEGMYDPYIVHKIFGIGMKNIERAMGVYVLSGSNIFTSCELVDSIKFQVQYKSVDYDIVIDHTTKHFFSAKDLSS